MTTLEKGKIYLLDYSKEARRRITVGLQWDARNKATLMDTISRTAAQHDLDLNCFIYDIDNDYIDLVTADPAQAIDKTGKIYHSGDDTDGVGAGDDEQISIEFKDLPGYVQNIVFVVEIRSNHQFADIAAPKIRVADALKDETLYELHLDHQDGQDKKAYIAFALSWKDKAWTLKYIDDYVALAEVDDWGAYLTQYLG